MPARLATEPPAAREEGSPDLPIGTELDPLEDVGPEDPAGDPEDDARGPEEARGLPIHAPDEDLSGLDHEIADERDVTFDAAEPREDLLQVAERAAEDDDDAPGPAIASDGEDGSDELGGLEAEAAAEEGDEPGDRRGEDDDLAALDEDDHRDDDAGAEGIADEDPSAAIEEAPAIDGAEGEGEGLDEALPELEEHALQDGDEALRRPSDRRG